MQLPLTVWHSSRLGVLLRLEWRNAARCLPGGPGECAVNVLGSEQEVDGSKSNIAVHLDLEIGDGVATDVALDDCVGAVEVGAQLAGLAGESARSGPFEGLIAAETSIGI